MPSVAAIPSFPVVPIAETDPFPDAIFDFAPIPAEMQADMCASGAWTDECPVPLDRLSLLRLSYYDFDGGPHTDGEMIVMDVVAPYVVAIFRKLFSIKFPIERIRLTDKYGGDDYLSMNDNNTSAFNSRRVLNGTLMSIHSFGLAVDLNPLQNPYIVLEPEHDLAKVFPHGGLNYLNRANRRPGMVEDVVDMFVAGGLSVWGGSWNGPIDLHHFQTSRAAAQLLAVMAKEHAEELYQKYAAAPSFMNRLGPEKEGLELVDLYGRDPELFMAALADRLAPLSRMELGAAMAFIRRPF